MASEYQYKRFVIGHNYIGSGLVGGTQPAFNDKPNYNDNPKKWEMIPMTDTTLFSYWKVGYINDRIKDQTAQRYPFLALYWWCRGGDWLPYWGESTKKRAQLMKEIRAYWLNDWFGKTIPEIKNILLETNKLIPDIVNELPNYLEYPYQIKSPPFGWRD